MAAKKSTQNFRSRPRALARAIYLTALVWSQHVATATASWEGFARANDFEPEPGTRLDVTAVIERRYSSGSCSSKQDIRRDTTGQW